MFQGFKLCQAGFVVVCVSARDRFLSVRARPRFVHVPLRGPAARGDAGIPVGLLQRHPTKPLRLTTRARVWDQAPAPSKIVLAMPWRLPIHLVPGLRLATGQGGVSALVGFCWTTAHSFVLRGTVFVPIGLKQIKNWAS